MNTLNKLVTFGWGRRIRTSPAWSRAMCPTTRLSPKGWELSSEDRIFQQQLQSFLPKPHPQKVTPTKIAPVLGLRYQPSQLWPADFLFASPTKARVYNKATDNGNETIPQAAAPTPRGTIPRSADETEAMMDPSTLPESVTEVASC